MNPGLATRVRYQERMQATEVGAQVARSARAWTIVQRRFFDGAVSLTLRRGRRTFKVSVPGSITGPCWADVDLRPVRAAPTQRSLLPGGQKREELTC